MTEHYDVSETLPERSETAVAATLNTPSSASIVSAKRRRPKTEKELYAEATERAKSLREKLLARRSKNRDQFIEDLYRQLEVETIDGDLDESDRLTALRSTLGQRLGPGPQGPR